MNETIEKFNNYARLNKLRKSGQRDAIVAAIIDQKTHFSVDQLHNCIKQRNPEIGIATIYRTVKLLLDAKIVKECTIDGTPRYEIITGSHHDHLVCTRCGSTVEISSEIIEREQISIAEKHGFELTDHSLVLMGICSACRKKTGIGKKS